MTGSRDAVEVTVTAMTHRGAVRDGNEDAFVIGGLTAAGVDTLDPVVVRLLVEEPAVVAVADGLGGHNAGEIAAALTVRRLAEHARDAGVDELLREINAELYALAEADPGCAGAGTTTVGLWLTPRRMSWFNVGDSRLYREDGGRLGQVSVDDSPVAGRGGPGRTPEVTNLVLQTLGGAQRFEPVHPHTGTERYVPGSRWLICSDGLSDLVDVAAMELILAENAGDDVRAVKALWVAAMNAGGRDNITALLVRC
ncbi:protein phosphatase 2C domain-containing protein [Kitasatospora sp. NBC_00240]|uniref:PP2C family protein-serine/threonine phosphatase n=1 Tax=Kitasatospora sp. NBC_00240 TaxID=2903567 RepID=UPI0022574721|nr:protein phosphatase 2C domain-containing protein [Kitasatospora sp. NBC_00240]MCX5208767.1 protein phosphatase 2C domain-containing protein [Kitasatospora sp. NBC_00240]